MRLRGRVSLKFLVTRLLWGIPVLFAVVTVAFFVMRYTPGGPFDREKPLPPAVEANLRRQYRLDRPLLPVYTAADEADRQKELDTFAAAHTVVPLGGLNVVVDPSGIAETQYFAYLGQLATGDFGVSMKFTQISVNDILWRTFPVSTLLGLTAFLLAFGMGITLGVVAAARRGTWIDGVTMVGATFGFSMPNFVLGIVLILVFALGLKWLPPALWEGPSYLILPALTLVLVVTAHMMRMTRAAIINLLASPYIEMARLKGTPPWKVIVKHALPNAWAPIINVVALNLAYLITGVVLVEVVFVYPGIGQALVDAVSKRDFPVVQACCLIFAATFILLNLAADVGSILTNPRLRHPK